MIRKENSIQDLKDNLKYEWRPVYAAHFEDDEGNRVPSIKVVLICEWRMDDGKVMCVEVSYETPEELAEIVAALNSAVEPFAKALAERFTKLTDEAAEEPSDVS